jgi:DNA polymerase alpha-associated DNA helicase A
VAVDNLVSRLAALPNPPSIVRLGHPARITPAAAGYSLDHLVAKHGGSEVVREAREEMRGLLRVSEDEKARYGERKGARKEMKVRRATVYAVPAALLFANSLLCSCCARRSGSGRTPSCRP